MGWFGGQRAPVEGLVNFFAEDHRRCDDLWAAVEDAADVGQAFEVFEAAMRRHLQMEEEVLFPAFDEATGMHGAGPVAVMRTEHDQMRRVLDLMRGCAASGDRAGLTSMGDTLLMLVQQHNVKEEGMLYPMAAAHLDWPTLQAQLAEY